MTFHRFPGYVNNIRLTQEYVDAIKRCFTETFPNSSHLWIFGSRVDMNAKGGDIDLYIETDIQDSAQLYNLKKAFLKSLFVQLNERRVDVVINTGGDFKLPIYEVARKEGVKIV